MPSTQTTLKAINSLTPITWSNFVHALPDKPPAFIDRGGWSEILNTVGALEAMELITVVRDKNTNLIETVALTPLGSERLRESEEIDRAAIARKQVRIERDRVRRHVW